MHIGQNIRIIRERIGMTQAELAQKLGYKSRSSINKIESGENDIPQSKVIEFANALGVTVFDLMDPAVPAASGAVPATTGKRIRDRRKELGISAEYLAEHLGVSPATIYRYENGSIEKVPGCILPRISKILNTTPAYLLGISIGENIRLLREAHGLTQAEFGRIAGVSGKAVSTWEADLRTPRIGALQRLSEHFGIPKSQIIDDKAYSMSEAESRRVFQRRLNQLLEENDMDQQELAAALGVSTSAVSNWASGINIPRMEKIERIARLFGVSRSSLIEGPVAPIPPGFSPLPETVRLPIVGQIACGTPITAEQNVEDYVEVPVSARATFVLRCRGDSMAPLIQDGDLVYIRKQPTVETGEIAAVRIGEEATLKLVYASPGQLILQPENHDYPPQVYAGAQLEEVAIEGKVVGIYRIMENR